MSSQLLTALAAGLVAVGSVAAAAPAEKPQPSRHDVAVIDVNKIFKDHVRLKVMLADLKGDVARADERFKADQQEIKDMALGLKDLLAGTRDYLDLQEKVNKRAEDLKTRVQLQRAEFLEREAAAYGAIYKEIAREVADYAAHNGIDIVLRVNTARAEPKTPQEVIQEMNRQVVWFADSRDISQIILDRLNQKGAAPKTPPAKPKKKPDGKKD